MNNMARDAAWFFWTRLQIDKNLFAEDTKSKKILAYVLYNQKKGML